jgi:hypothetical protein
MSEVIIKEVVTKKDLKDFVLFPHGLYKDSPYWVPTMIFDDMETLSKEKNPAFEFCKAKYWMAFRGKKIVGRIAGIINTRALEIWKIKFARFGWIDFIDDPEVSRALIQTVETWAKQEGMEGVQGPLGFTDFDKEGMLIEGFDELATIAGIYNYPYYPVHMEKLGYSKEVDWVEHEMNIHGVINEKVKRLADIVERRYGLKIVKLKKAKEILKYTHEIFQLLNFAYKDLFGFVPLSEKQIEYYTKMYFSFIRPEFVPLVFDKDDKLVAVGVTVPSLSKAFKKAKGRVFPFGFIHLFRAMKKNDRINLLLVGVRKDYLGKGVNAILMNECNKVFIENNMNIINATHQLETNTKIQSFWDYYDNRVTVRRRCYSKKIKQA